MKKHYEHIIKGGTILCMDASFRVLEDHFICIDGGKIVDILPLELIGDYEADYLQNGFDCLIIPALINAHSHLPMTYFRGLADDMALNKWLGEYIWPLEARMVNADFVYDASLHGAAEMLKNGICLTNDMYFHCERIVQACSRVGMRVIVSDAIIERDSNVGTALYEARMLDIQDYCQDFPLADCAFAPHAIYTCSKDLLQSAAEFALKHNWLLHTHLSETRGELEDCLKTHGTRPLDYLADLGWLENKCLFAHGVWLSPEELKRLGKSNSAVAVCTDSNLKLASGFAPLKAMNEHGVCYALGSDGVASNNNLDLLEELSTTAKLHKTLTADPEFMPAREAFAHITIEAAKALGKEDSLGSLEIGKAADLCIIDTQNLQSSPLYNPYSQLLYAMGSHQMRDVMVDGTYVVKNYQLVNLDEAELVHTANEYKVKIIKELNK
ncbi:MAG: amidohydrolase [Candidatus Cloacimonetes bacterium]|jgi:5-methylthioadenosine/S-adenosylhomocysteine deaminase|nr:amidohydrolase [Candidatus Cloacimonadota bacterium]